VSRFEVEEKPFTGVFVWRGDLPRFISVRRSNEGEEKHMTLPADPADAEDFDVTAEALDRGQRARLIRKTRTGLGLSQSEFARRFRVPVGTLRDWEQTRATAPDFAIAYVRVISQHPDIVANAVA
jgi:putative transcriptional regulator